ncbi:MAG: asparagine synthase-related protein [Acidobacteriota bacterium]
MPGLFGMVGLHRGRPLEPDSVHVLADMASRLSHIGAEQVDTWTDLAGGFAVSRVGLRHLMPLAWPGPGEAPGWAPGPADEPRSRVFLDGALHRDSPRAEDLYREARPSDAEVMRRLEGFYSGVFYHSGSERSVSLAVDRRASRPLAWTVVDGVLYFAPEVKALLAVQGFERSLDMASLGVFFASGFTLADRTLFRFVRRIEGGHLLSIRGDGDVQVERYADYRFTVDGDGTPYDELRTQLGQQMRRSVERNFIDPEQTAVFLSGGKDSRAILASAVGSVDDPSKVRAVSWTSNDPQPGSDVHLARQIARHLGTQYTEIRRSVDGFADKALRLTYVLDGLTDVGAFHGDELRVMEDLAGEGFVRVLRGDQCFTRGRSMLDPAYAILRMCLRSTSGLANGRSAWRAAAHRDVCEAGDAMLAALAREYADVQEDNVGDQVYFRHRLQGYLNSAGYFKQLVLDHRNPLLDEGLLRLVQRLSIAARREQKILNEAGAEAFPEVWGPFPFADRSNLEDFVDLLARDTPVRRAVSAALQDRTSAVWDYLDRSALLSRLDSLRASGGRANWRSRLKSRVKTFVRDAVYDIPSVDVRVRGVYLRRETREDEVFLRVLTLKHFFDLFVTGDGGREAFEESRERLGNVNRPAGAGGG